MATTCQIYPVDYPRTAGSRLLDLNDPTGANALDVGYTSTQLLQTVDLGSPQFEFDRFSPPQRDGGSTTNQRAGFRNVVIPFRMRASSYDNLAQAMGRLSSYISQGCTIVWQADTSSNVRYIDVEPSQTPYFLDGRELSMHLATTMVDTPDGIQLTLVAQPYLRGDELDSATNLLDNATLLRDANADERPDGWAWTSAANISAELIDPDDEAYRFDIATGATRILTQSTGAATAASGETWTMSGYARVTSASYTNAQTQAVITWRTSAPADISTSSGTLVPLTTAWQRVSVTATAPATTDRIQAGLQMDNTSATSARVQWKNLQLEEASTATPFHVGSEVGSADPEVGMGSMFPVYNPGDAPAAVSVRFANTTVATWGMRIGAAVNPMGIGGTAELPALLNTAHFFQAEDFTVGTDTALDTNASSSPTTGNTGLLTTFVTTTMSRRASLTMATAATLDALRGHTFQVVARVAARTATYTGKIQLETVVPPGGEVTHPAITLTAISSGAYYEMPLGFITIPDREMVSVIFGLEASRTSGTGNLVWDFIELVPADAGIGVYRHGNTVGTSSRMVSLPEQGRWTVESAGVESSYTGAADTNEARGPIPFVLPPGLSMVYASAEFTAVPGIIDPEGYLSHTITNATVAEFVLTPRYYL